MSDLEHKLNHYLAQIVAPDQPAMDAAARYQALLAKPPGSLGKLEDIAIRLAGITGTVKNEITKKIAALSGGEIFQIVCSMEVRFRAGRRAI